MEDTEVELNQAIEMCSIYGIKGVKKPFAPNIYLRKVDS